MNVFFRTFLHGSPRIVRWLRFVDVSVRCDTKQRELRAIRSTRSQVCCPDIRLQIASRGTTTRVMRFFSLDSINVFSSFLSSSNSSCSSRENICRTLVRRPDQSSIILLARHLESLIHREIQSKTTTSGTRKTGST